MRYPESAPDLGSAGATAERSFTDGREEKFPPLETRSSGIRRNFRSLDRNLWWISRRIDRASTGIHSRPSRGSWLGCWAAIALPRQAARWVEAAIWRGILIAQRPASVTTAQNAYREIETSYRIFCRCLKLPYLLRSSAL